MKIRLKVRHIPNILVVTAIIVLTFAAVLAPAPAKEQVKGPITSSFTDFSITSTDGYAVVSAHDGTVIAWFDSATADPRVTNWVHVTDLPRSTNERAPFGFREKRYSAKGTIALLSTMTLPDSTMTYGYYWAVGGIADNK